MRSRLTLAFVFLCAIFAGAQTAVMPVVNPHVVFFNTSGTVCAGCLLTTDAAGTSTPLATFSDSAGSVPNSNPITLSSDGSAVIYLQLASYKFILKTAAGVTIYTQDNISAVTAQSTFASITSTGNQLINPAVVATGSANQSSPTLSLCGFYFNVSSLNDCWVLSAVVGPGPAPTSTFTVSHSGSGGAATANLPFAVQLNSIQSKTANPATSGFVQLATGDTACWRNAANGANVCLSDPGIAAQGTGNLADLLKWNGGGYQAAAFVDTSANPAASGVLRVANNVVAVAARNGAGNSDVALLQADTQNNAFIPAPIRQTEIAAPTGILGSDLLWADSTAHRWKMVNNNGVLDPVVGQATVDPLTGKTLTGASTGNTVNLLSSGCPPQGPTASINGTGAAADIFTCPLPVNVIENNKILHVICSGVHDTGVANVAMTMNLNGQNITSGQTGTTGSQSWSMEAYVLRTGTTTGQAWGISPTSTGNNGTMVAFSIGLTGLSWTSGTQTLNCQFTVAAGDHMTGRVWAPMSIQ